MKTFNNLKIFIEKRYQDGQTYIWLREERPSEIINISYNGENLTLTSMKYDEQAPKEVKPFIKLSSHMARHIFKAMADYTSKEGIKTTDENLLKGKMEATEKHLEDMREFSRELLNVVIKNKKR